MAPTPITASHRITFPITSAGFVHKARYYCNATLVGGLYELTDPGGGANVPWHDAVDQLSVLLGDMYSAADSVFGTALLETYAGGPYLPTATHTPSNQPAVALSYKPAWGLTISLYDSLFYMAKSYLLESVYGTEFRFVTRPVGDTALDAYLTSILAPPGAADLGHWMRSRAARQITSFIAAVSDPNDKIRRRRGLL